MRYAAHMAEKKNTRFNRPGGYAMPSGATQTQRRAAMELKPEDIRLFGDGAPPYSAEVRGQKSEVSDNGTTSPADPSPSHRLTAPGGSPSHSERITPSPSHPLTPSFQACDPDTRLYIGDCREVLANLPDKGNIDLVFADPPFNWEVPYDGWKDGMPRREYERFTFDWIDGCIDCLAPHGSIFINIPDDTAAEVVLHLKRRGLTMINWCIWHFRFGQCRDSSFIMSKVHVLYFAKDARVLNEIGTKARRHVGTKGNQNGASGEVTNHSVPSCLSGGASVPSPGRIWNPDAILELSDRASIYADPRTMAKDTNKGLRVPMDVWYGKYWGRVQGNNKERRHNHHNQIPEIYLERVIKACSLPVPGWGSGIGTKARRHEGTKGYENASGTETTNHSVPSCLRASVPPDFGSLVLDPFCGSGTTSTVARALGRRSITIEYSKVNAASAWERITNVGMIPREDAGKPQSTAIFRKRTKRDVQSA
jgi:hypothetical protein